MLQRGVVLDACVLFPASVRDTVLRLAESGLYHLHWTDVRHPIAKARGVC